MKDDRVWTRSNDGPESVAARATLDVNIASGSLEFVLIHSGSSSLHRFLHAFSADFRALFDQLDFERCFDPAHVIQQRIQRLESELRNCLLNHTDRFL